MTGLAITGEALEHEKPNAFSHEGLYIDSGLPTLPPLAVQASVVAV
jgi:hypothetical protein